MKNIKQVAVTKVIISMLRKKALTTVVNAFSIKANAALKMPFSIVYTVLYTIFKSLIYLCAGFLTSMQCKQCSLLINNMQIEQAGCIVYVSCGLTFDIQYTSRDQLIQLYK